MCDPCKLRKECIERKGICLPPCGRRAPTSDSLTMARVVHYHLETMLKVQADLIAELVRLRSTKGKKK